MNSLRSLFPIAAALVCGAAAAGELLVTGQVESVLLLPKGAPACLDRGAMPRNGDGTGSVVVSNDCGCQQSRVRIGQTLLGKRQDAVAVIDTRLGEWCQPQLPLDQKTILIHVDDRGDMRWSPLVQRDGALWFSPKALRTVAGVDWRMLAVDGEGLAPLDRLLDQAGGSHK